LCEVDGFWDCQVSLKDVCTGEVSVLYDAQCAIGDLMMPVASSASSTAST
jgi:hypothetical protein